MTQHPYGEPQGTGEAPGDGVAPGQDSKFGTAAYDPQAAYGGPMEQPSAFRRLRTMTLVSMVICLISGVLEVVFSGDEDMIREQMEAQGQEATQEMIDIALITGIVFGALLLLVSVIIYIVVLLGLRHVKNWARILGTVFCALGIIVTGFGMLQAGTRIEAGAAGIISVVLSALLVIVNVVWLVIAFSKDNNAYFADRAKR